MHVLMVSQQAEMHDGVCIYAGCSDLVLATLAHTPELADAAELGTCSDVLVMPCNLLLA